MKKLFIRMKFFIGTYKEREACDFDRGGTVKHEIDYIFIRPSPTASLRFTAYLKDLKNLKRPLPVYGNPSDHLPVVAEIELIVNKKV